MPKWLYFSRFNCLKLTYSKCNGLKKVISKELRALAERSYGRETEKIRLFFEKIDIFGRNGSFFTYILPKNTLLQKKRLKNRSELQKILKKLGEKKIGNNYGQKRKKKFFFGEKMIFSAKIGFFFSPKLL